MTLIHTSTCGCGHGRWSPSHPSLAKKMSEPVLTERFFWEKCG